jgi:hypothetical protein
MGGVRGLGLLPNGAQTLVAMVLTGHQVTIGSALLMAEVETIALQYIFWLTIGVLFSASSV